MAFLDVDDIEPGMILKSDVSTSKGHVLLSAGTELTAKHIRILKGRAITSIDIVGADELYDRHDMAVAQILPIEATAPIVELFAGSNTTHPFIRELMRLCTQRVIGEHPGRETQ